MTTEYVDRCYLLINGTEVEAESITYRLNPGGKEVVATMNRQNRGRGFTGGVKTAELSIEVPEPKGGHVINLDQMCMDDEIFTAVVEYEGGSRRIFRDSTISDIEGTARVGDNLVTSINAKSLKPAFEPAR